MSKTNSGNDKLKLGFAGVLGILRPYIRSRFLEQLKSVWVIIAYLVLFQILMLQLPIVYSLTIALGVFIVIVGLMLFLEGLMLGLMPLGELREMGFRARESVSTHTLRNGATRFVDYAQRVVSQW